jgi:hypothetical protein
LKPFDSGLYTVDWVSGETIVTLERGVDIGVMGIAEPVLSGVEGINPSDGF